MRIGETRRLHSDWINLRKPALSGIVGTVLRVIKSGHRAAVVAGKGFGKRFIDDEGCF